MSTHSQKCLNTRHLIITKDHSPLSYLNIVSESNWFRIASESGWWEIVTNDSYGRVIKTFGPTIFPDNYSHKFSNSKVMAT